jgi:hypothetical protein
VGVEPVDKDELPYRGFQGTVQNVLVALVIDLQVRKPVGLSGDADGGEDDLDAVAEAPERFRLGDFAHEHVVHEVDDGGFEKRPRGHQLVRLSGQYPYPIVTILELLGDEPAEVARRTCNQHPVHGGRTSPSRSCALHGLNLGIHPGTFCL